MITEVEIRGTVLPDGSLQLDGSLGLPPGPVVVRARVVAPPFPMDPESIAQRHREMMELLNSFVEMSKQPGVTPRTAEEIDREIAEGRAEAEAEMRKIEAIGLE